MLISAETLRLCMPDATAENVAKYTPHLDAAMQEFDITTPSRMADAIAQIGHECGSLRYMAENLNYSAEGLLKTWPKRFTPELAAECARNPEKIANVVYANRMGNGPRESGDGWQHRGAGGIQLTGKETQSQCADYFGIPLEDICAWLQMPEGAMRSAGWFWMTRELNRFADVGDFIGETRAINGGTHGLPDRQARRKRARGVLGFME